MIKNQDIICFSFSDWDQEMVSNRYHMLTRFAKNNRVFLFERQLTLDDSRIRWLKFFKNPVRKKDGLYLIIPGVNLPTGILSKFYFLYYLRKIIKEFKIKEPIFWFYNYQLSYLLEKFPYKLSCYHCTEDYAESSRISSKNNVVDKIKKIENDFVCKVDLVFAVSEYLSEKHLKNNPQTYLVANAVDYKLYRLAQSPSRRIFGKKSILGYCGNVSDKVNFRLLYELAKKYPQYELVLVGPVQSNNYYIRKLAKRANARFLGRKPVEELPHLIREFDVCLIPFIQDAWFVKASQPLKLFEYMASGKPIVSTPMDCLKNLQDVVYVGQSTKEFLRQIQLALKETSKEKRSKRIRLASQNTWDKRFELINQKMEKFLCQKPK